MTTTTETIAYTTNGSVRGECGHVHRTYATAAACIARDHAGCKLQGGYSDRHVVPITLADALAMDRIPWALLVAAGVDLEDLAIEAGEYGDMELARMARAAARRY